MKHEKTMKSGTKQNVFKWESSLQSNISLELKVNKMQSSVIARSATRREFLSIAVSVISTDAYLSLGSDINVAPCQSHTSP